MSESTTIFTIGHSNHEIGRFLGLLNLHDIKAIADVRSWPYSRYNPQFNRESLCESLAMNDIGYVFLGEELGARRSEPECYVDGRVDYDLVANSPRFMKGIERLVQGANKMRIAMMCAEKDPLTCHRAILVARKLRAMNIEVCHILDNGFLEDHAAAEKRLLRENDLFERDLFFSDIERLQQAYEIRGREIAYQQEPAEGNPS